MDNSVNSSNSEIKAIICFQYAWTVALNHEIKNKKMALNSCKKPSVLFRGITPKNNDLFYCLNCFHSCWTDSKLKSHKKVCINH